MKVLFIGDVVGMRSCEALQRELHNIKQKLGAEVIIVNGENSAEGNGINPASAGAIFDAGADVITTGNHCFRQKTMEAEWEHNERIIRPANFDDEVSGRGICVLDRGAYSIAVSFLMGTTYMQPLERAALRSILTEPKNAIVKQYKRLFELDGVKLAFDDDALDYIVDKAVEFKLGARGLRSICEAVMMDSMFELPSRKNSKKSFTVTLDYARSKIDNEKFRRLKAVS